MAATPELTRVIMSWNFRIFLIKVDKNSKLYAADSSVSWLYFQYGRKVKLNLRARSAYFVRGMFTHNRRGNRSSQEVLQFEDSR